MKRILTLQDLVALCSQNKFSTFDSEKAGFQLCVHVPAVFENTESDEHTLYGYVKLMHTGKNRNGSNLTEEAAKNCLSSIAYKPLLADFCEIDGVEDFTSHAFHEDQDGNIVYDERQVGAFTADPPELKEDGEHPDRKYVFAKVAIPREYTHTAQIIERKNGKTKVSAQLCINKMSYDAKNKMLNIDDVQVLGGTCLGVNPKNGKEVKEGMEGAVLQLEDFSVENNSIKFNKDDKGIDLALNHKQSVPTDPNTNGKEDKGLMDGKDNNKPETPVSGISFQVNGKTFELSLSDIQGAISRLVNNTYSEADNTWYWCSVYPESKIVVMQDWDGTAYRQNYEVENDNYSLVGDRVAVHAIYVTDEEEQALNDAKKNFEETKKSFDEATANLEAANAELESVKNELNEKSEKLSKYEAEPEKMKILNSEDYSNVADTEEFSALKKQEEHFDLSVDEVKNKADEILLNYAKSHKNFASEEKAGHVMRKPLPTNAKQGEGRYGSLFSDNK